MKKLGLIFGMIMAFMIAPSVLGASIISCGSPASGVHTLDNDISINNGNDCLILSNNTVIDGQGYTIYGNCSMLRSTVTPLTNVTIYNVNLVKNGTCAGTSSGIFAGIVNNLTLENVTITQTGWGDGWGFGGLQACFSQTEAPHTCDSITYRNITININASSQVGGINTTLTNLIMDDIYANTTGSAGHGAIWVVKPTNAVMSNIQAYSNQVGIEITNAGSGVEMSNITISSTNDGLQLTSDDISVTNATITSGGDGIFIGTGADNITLNDINITTTGAGHGIFTYALGVLDLTIDGLYMDGSNVDTNHGIYNIVGFNLNVNDFVIMNYGNGILFYQSSGMTLTNGQFYNMNVTGNLSLLSASGGAVSVYSSNNTRIENIYVNNTLSSGISYVAPNAPPPLRPSTNHELINATIHCTGFCGQQNRGSPISLLGVKNLTVSESTFSNNSKAVFATSWFSWMDYREDIWFFNNTFINNVDGNTLFNTTAINVNFNDSAYGNSWDDYADCDDNGDGIGRTPYVINTTLGIYDYLPLTANGCLSNNMTVSSPTNTSYPWVDANYSFMLNVSSNLTVDAWWYQLNSNGTNVTFSPNVTLSGVVGQNNITIWANDTYGDEESTIVFFTMQAEPAPPSVTGGFLVNNPEYALIPLVLVVVLLSGLVGALLSSKLDMGLIIKLGIAVIVTVVFVGVMFMV